MDKLEFGAYQAVEKCMKVQPGERVVIIADRETDKIARVIEEANKKVTPRVTYFIMEDFGARPLKMPEQILQALKQADVSFYCAAHADGEFALFREPIYKWVAKSRLRHAVMPNISREIMEQGMNVDYDELKKFTAKVFEILSKARNIRVQTALGTDLEVRVGKWKWYQCNGDIKPGKYSNLPDGEVFTSPEDVNGTAVIDGVLGDYLDKKYGLICSNPVRAEIKDCRAVLGSIKCENEALREEVENYIFRQSSPNSTRIGEFAMGTNLNLETLVGNTLQDEKFPSVHIAFGDSLEEDTGCPYTCDYHIDAVMLKPTVVVDGREIMRQGKYLI